MRTKTFVLAVAALAAGRLAGASVLYNVTDLGPGYALQADASDTTHAVSSADGSVAYAFDKSPVWAVENPEYRYSADAHLGSYSVDTLTNGQTTVGYSYDFGGNLPHPSLLFRSAWGMWPGSPIPLGDHRASNPPFDPFNPDQKPVIYAESPVSDFNVHNQAVGTMENADAETNGISHKTYAAFSQPGFLGHQSNLDPYWASNNLNRYIDLPGTSLTTAFKIDDLGRILARGDDDHVYLLSPLELGAPTPVPEPSALALLGVVAASWGVQSIRRRPGRRGGGRGPLGRAD